MKIQRINNSMTANIDDCYIDKNNPIYTDFYYNAYATLLMSSDYDIKYINTIYNFADIIRLYKHILRKDLKYKYSHTEDKIFEISKQISINYILNYESINLSINELFEKLKNKSEKYKLNKNCFCLVLYKNKKYISISGSSNDYIGTLIKNFGYTSSYKTILNDINADLFNNEAVLCHLDDNCYLTTNKLYKNLKIIRLCDIYNLNNSINLNILFSCCERKIISNIENFNSSDAIFYCKYLFCKYCIHFLINSKFICVYDNKIKELRDMFRDDLYINKTMKGNYKKYEIKRIK